MRTVINSPLPVWFFLALPGLAAGFGFAGGRLDAMEMLHPTGEWAVRWMVVAMAIGPLAALAGPRRWSRWLLARRRWFGFAAFLYALGHLVFYVIDMGTLADMLAEIGEHGIWTGWLALALMAVPGLTSTDAAVRALQAGWKRAQRLAYPAALFTALHWGLLELRWGGVLVHFGPLVALHLLRLGQRARNPKELTA